MRAKRETPLNAGAGTGDRGEDEARTPRGSAQPEPTKEEREGHRDGRTETELGSEKEAKKRKIETNRKAEGEKQRHIETELDRERVCAIMGRKRVPPTSIPPSVYFTLPQHLPVTAETGKPKLHFPGCLEVGFRKEV